ncbi:MAG: 30S ribosome-binding factor RbfA [Actinomycetota bacterium]
MTDGPRTSRVSEGFREILAEEIPKLKDPRVGFITVTGVKVSPDLRRAWVYYTAMGDERERRSSAAALRSASPHLRRVIGAQVRLKVLPELTFEEDDTEETAERIESLFRKLRQGERGAPAPRPSQGERGAPAPRPGEDERG